MKINCPNCGNIITFHIFKREQCCRFCKQNIITKKLSLLIWFSDIIAKLISLIFSVIIGEISIYIIFRIFIEIVVFLIIYLILKTIFTSCILTICKLIIKNAR